MLKNVLKKMKGKKILIIGYGRHGKDTLAEIWRDKFGLSFISSSMAASELVIFPALKQKYNYQSVEQCFEDRSNHRQEWFELIEEYNKEDPSRLCKDIIFKMKNDCYVGMRSKIELEGSKNFFDLIIFVDASDRLPVEDKKSCTIGPHDADIIITNNQGLEEFQQKAVRIGKSLI